MLGAQGNIHFASQSEVSLRIALVCAVDEGKLLSFLLFLSNNFRCNRNDCLYPVPVVQVKGRGEIVSRLLHGRLQALEVGAMRGSSCWSQASAYIRTAGAERASAGSNAGSLRFRKSLCPAITNLSRSSGGILASWSAR